MSGPPLPYDDIRLLSLDAGNTIVFLDHAALAAIVSAELGRTVAADAVERAEGVAKQRLDDGLLLPPLPDADIAAPWGALVATVVHLAAAVEPERAVELTRTLWREHRRLNLWRKVPDGLAAAVAELRGRGVPVVVTSNSEGQLQGLLDQLGLGAAFDLVIDSHHAGVEKPDPRIFALALAPFGVPAAQALHLGDTFATDVVGGRAAGMQVALIDPFGHYRDRYSDVPRVSDVAAVCRRLGQPRR